MKGSAAQISVAPTGAPEPSKSRPKRLFVQIKEDDKLLNGDATGVNLDGLLNQLPGENQDIASDADAPNAADNVFAAISKAEEAICPPTGSSFTPAIGRRSGS